MAQVEVNTERRMEGTGEQHYIGGRKVKIVKRYGIKNPIKKMR